MRNRSYSRLSVAALLALVLMTLPVSLQARAESPVASPAALDASMVTGSWVARANDQRNGQVDGETLQGAPKILWQSDQHGDAYLAPAPGDHLVIAQTAFLISALDRETGAVYWQAPMSSTGSAPSLVDGVIYTGSVEGLHALDARTGQTLWTFVPTHDPNYTPPTGYPPLTLVDAPVAVVDGVVYTSGGPYGGLYAVDAKTGDQLWSYDTMGGMPAVVAVADGMLYLLSEIGLGGVGTFPDDTPSRLQVLDAATGSLVWDTAFPAGWSTTSPPVILGDTVLVGLSHYDGAYLGAWNAYDRASGELRWSLPTATPVWGAQAGGKDGRFYVPGSEATGVTAVDAETGAVLWQHDTASMVWSGVLAVGDEVYLRTEDPQQVQALDAATGALLWSLSLDDLASRAASGLSYADGVLYLGAGTKIFAIAGDGGAAPEPGPPVLASTAALEPNADAFLQWSGVLQGPEPLSGPDGVAVNPQNGEIMVVDAKNDRFQIFTSNGTFDRVWGKAGRGPGEFVFHEQDGWFVGDAAFGADGTLYVADTGNHRIQVFDADLNHQRDIQVASDDPQNPARPTGIAVDDERGRIYVTDFQHNVLNVFSFEGDQLGQWGASGPDSDLGLQGPSDVAVGADGTVYVVDSGRGKVRLFDPDGAPLAVWGGRGTGPGQFVAPTSIAFDSQGNTYVTDYVLNRIQVIAPDGMVIGMFGAEGSGDGQFMNPAFLAFTPDGRLVVTDESNNRAVVLTTPFTAPAVATPEASPTA